MAGLCVNLSHALQTVPLAVPGKKQMSGTSAVMWAGSGEV